MSDTIDRQAAIDAAAFGITYAKELRKVIDRINALPSAEPQRKKGKWIKMSDADGIYWACSECGEDIPRTESIDKINFCPNCGADMRGE